MAVDSAGNAYVTGASMGLDSSLDYATVKYNSDGIQQWVARRSGAGKTNDWPIAMALDRAGNVYVTGISDSATVKYSSDGVQQWAATYDGAATAIGLGSGGEVYVTGYNAAVCKTAKYNAAGVELWTRLVTYAPSNPDVTPTLAVDRAGNVCISGIDDDYTVVKYDPVGTLRWSVSYEGTPGGYDFAGAIAADSAGSVYVTGASQGASGFFDYATAKYDSSGTRAWVARYDGPDHSNDWATALHVAGSGDVYVTGRLRASFMRACETVKYGPDGSQRWASIYQYVGGELDFPAGLAVDHEGNVYVAGGSLGDFATVACDSTGNERWVAYYNGPGNGDDLPHAVAVDGVGNVYVTGHSPGLRGDDDYATVKYLLKSQGVEEQRERTAEVRGPSGISLIIAPNPTRRSLAVRYTLPEGRPGILSILDAAGRVIESRVVTADASRFTADVPPGVYFVRLTSDGQERTAKVVRLN